MNRLLITLVQLVGLKFPDASYRIKQRTGPGCNPRFFINKTGIAVRTYGYINIVFIINKLLAKPF